MTIREKQNGQIFTILYVINLYKIVKVAKFPIAKSTTFKATKWITFTSLTNCGQRRL